MEDSLDREPRRVGVGAVLAGTAATFGLAVSTALTGVVVAGLLQWVSIPRWADNALPVLVLLLGLVLCGRVASDVAGRLGPWCGAGAGLLTLVVGLAVSKVSEAHGDGLEAPEVVAAAVVVGAVIAGTAWMVHRRRVAGWLRTNG